ncbi:hypothetical protein FRC10_005066 [Ceratobasidium sp. 414]|nr:hypothetical protein FRC10_005066 [Ceratobasidium sp. 414]
MANLNPQFRRLLCSIVLALAVANALPHNERELPESGIVDIASTDIHVPAGGEETLETWMGNMGQQGAAVMFEADPLMHEEARPGQAPTSLIDPGVLASDNPGAHRHIGPRTPITANNPHTVSGDAKNIHKGSRQYDLDEVEAAIREAVGSVPNGAKVQKRHGIEYPLYHDHAVDAANPVIITGNNNHVHAHTPNRHFDYPHLEYNPARHYHHNRKSNRPRRLREYQGGDNEGDREDTFIAPPSVRIKVGYKAKLRSSSIGGASAPTKLMKKPKPTAPTGYYRAVRPATTTESTGKGQGTNINGPVDQGDKVARRSALPDQATPVLAAARPANTLPVPDGIPGVIDLLSNANGTQLGSLSVSHIPRDASSDALWNGGATLAYIIDATTNPAEQITFYMRCCDDQTLLRTEPSTNPATHPMHDLLVSFQVAGASPLCATFNPHAGDVQMFGLATCLGTGVGAGNSSQAFRYSPGTGVVRPFYRVEAENNTVAVLVEQVDNLESGYSALGSDSNATAVVPGPTPIYFSPDPLLRPVSFLNESVPSNSNSLPPSPEPLILGIQSTSGPARTLVVGDSEVVSQLSAGEGKEGDIEDEGVLMVFRRVYASMDEQDVLVEHGGLNSGAFEEGGSSGPAQQASRTLEARSVGPPVGHTGREPIRGDITTVTEARVEIVPNSPETTLPFRSQPSLPLSPKPPLAAPDSMNPTASYNGLNESDPDLDNLPLPKPMINVAYFGDSGRSPPVPPQAQADGARAILLAVASKDQKPHAGPVPVTLATASEEDIMRVYLVGPGEKVKDTDRVASVAQTGGWEDSADSLPVDASD